MKKVDDADRVKVQVLTLKLQKVIADYNRLKEEGKRIELEKALVLAQGQDLKAQRKAALDEVLRKYEIKDFDLDTGEEVVDS